MASDPTHPSHGGDPEADRVAALVAAALGLDEAAAGAFVSRSCAGEPELAAEVLSLVQAARGAQGFMGGATMDQSSAMAGAFTPAERPGDRIGPYHLLEIIGEGGFGTVFLAEQEEPVRRRVALKVVRVGMDTGAVMARFEAERNTLAMMEHPGIARVLDAGATEGRRPYFVMEYVPGLPITRFCDEHRLPVRRRLDLLAEVCTAVQHAHTKGVIHRDLKPSNILVTTVDDKPVVKVIDFGIAKAVHDRSASRAALTLVQQLVGTPEYMSPEQAEGAGDIDTRSDVYSLGVLMYELLTGTTPFEGERLRAAAMAEVQRILREEPPPRPSTRLTSLIDAGDTRAIAAARATEPASLSRQVKGDLDWIVLKALNKDRSGRYGSPAEFAADLNRHLRHEVVLARAPSRTVVAARFVRRHRIGVAAAAIVLAALVAATIVSRIALVRARGSEARAHAQEKEANEQAARATALADFLSGTLFTFNPRSDERVEGTPGSTEYAVKDLLLNAEAQVAKRFPDDAQTRARLYEMLGGAFETLAMPEQSIGALRRALEERRLASGEGEGYYSTMAGLGHAVWVLGDDIEEPIGLMREAYEGVERLSGTRSRLTRSYGMALANMLIMTGRLDEGERVLDRVRKAIAEYAPDDKDVGAQCALARATLSNLLGRYRTCEELSLEVRRGMRGTRPGERFRQSVVLEAWVDSLMAQGRWKDAEAAAAELINVYTEQYGADHPAVSTARCALAMALSRSDPAGAEELLRGAIKAIGDQLGPDGEWTRQPRFSLAEFLVDQKRFAEAEEVLRALMGPEAEAPDPAFDKVLPNRLFAEVFLAQNKADRAATFIEAALAASERASPGCAFTPRCRNVKGRILLAQARWDEAEGALRGAYEGESGFEGADPERLAGFARDVVRLYGAWDLAGGNAGHAEAMRLWRERSENISR
jgi:serine/threonine protein kinase/tetratricopeptide (TPR) repeat protein